MLAPDRLNSLTDATTYVEQLQDTTKKGADARLVYTYTRGSSRLMAFPRKIMQHPRGCRRGHVQASAHPLDASRRRNDAPSVLRAGQAWDKQGAGVAWEWLEAGLAEAHSHVGRLGRDVDGACNYTIHVIIEADSSVA